MKQRDDNTKDHISIADWADESSKYKDCQDLYFEIEIRLKNKSDDSFLQLIDGSNAKPIVTSQNPQDGDYYRIGSRALSVR